MHRYIGVLIPVLPEKKAFGSTASDVVKQRMRGLGLFLDALLDNPYIKRDKILEQFLNVQDASTFEDVKKVRCDAAEQWSGQSTACRVSPRLPLTPATMKPRTQANTGGGERSPAIQVRNVSTGACQCFRSTLWCITWWAHRIINDVHGQLDAYDRALKALCQSSKELVDKSRAYAAELDTFAVR